jgi:glycosyltransferase involved in cell wall biosynthesis
MSLSVVVPTLNGRDRLVSCLDTLAEHAPDAEVIVVNGPSADGTTGTVQDRTDVDTLIEVPSRNPNVARNAGIDAATGDSVALLGFDLQITDTWVAAIEDGLAEADAVTGPVYESAATHDSAVPDHATFRGRRVTFFNGRNVAFRADALDMLDGFDEYLQTGGDRDAAHRLTTLDRGIVWRYRMEVRQEFDEDDGFEDVDWTWSYRARAYSLAKNYGVAPTVAIRLVLRAARDAISTATDTVRGDRTPTTWLGNGRNVVSGIATGVSDGMIARSRDRTPARNPHGVSARADRAIERYDFE